jgi:hypothetical protein
MPRNAWQKRVYFSRPSGGSAGCLAALEALAAENRATLGRPERDRGFAAALGADGRGFHFSRRTCTPFLRAALALCLASLTSLRLVSEVFFVVKLLLARGEYEVRAAVDAFELPIVKFGHGHHPSSEYKRRSGCHPLRLFKGYSISRRLFFRFRFRARAALTRFFSPGFR